MYTYTGQELTRAEVTTYVLVPDGRYPEKEAKLEVDMAVQYLINETGGFQRKVRHFFSFMCDGACG